MKLRRKKAVVVIAGFFSSSERRTGESQRKDGLYEYRYTDANKKRHSIYDSDLMRLRKRQDEIQKMRYEGIDYAGGEITVIELLE